MAPKAAHTRLVREYAELQKNPTPYIIAHPSESNILEWHYILTGPPETPYKDGQYWGTLVFPPEYPFAPPAIRMHTPSGRFQPSTRLCLSISDFHPRSFNPAWSVSTILIGLMSFMTSDEMTTGSIGASNQERERLAARSRWWNATGGGSSTRRMPGKQGVFKTAGSIKAGDGGAKFRSEWPELDEENWKWMDEHEIDPQTGMPQPLSESASAQCSPEAAALRRRLVGGASGRGKLVRANEAGQGWLSRHKTWLVIGIVFVWVVLARVFGEDD